MKTVDAVDGEIRFTAHWGGLDRYVFIPDPYVSNDAGSAMSREEAIAFVRDNLDRYKAEARAQHGDDNPVKIVILARHNAHPRDPKSTPSSFTTSDQRRRADRQLFQKRRTASALLNGAVIPSDHE